MKNLFKRNHLHKFFRNSRNTYRPNSFSTNVELAFYNLINRKYFVLYEYHLFENMLGLVNAIDDDFIVSGIYVVNNFDVDVFTEFEFIGRIDEFKEAMKTDIVKYWSPSDKIKEITFKALDNLRCDMIAEVRKIIHRTQLSNKWYKEHSRPKVEDES